MLLLHDACLMLQINVCEIQRARGQSLSLSVVLLLDDACLLLQLTVSKVFREQRGRVTRCVEILSEMSEHMRRTITVVHVSA